MPITTKICGITTKEAVIAAVEEGVDYLGFIFYPPSPRHLTLEKAKKLMELVPSTVAKVAVLVDAEDKEIDKIVEKLAPSFLQFHGSESPERIYDVHVRYALPVIKAIPVSGSGDIAAAIAYADVADMLLFDTKPAPGALPGGTGVTFDWTLLKMHEFTIPWFLSGGLTLANVEEAVRISGAQAVDISSGLESRPGVKDPELVRLFLEKVKAL